MRVNPRSVIVAALQEGPRTLTELGDAMWIGLGGDGEIGGRGISIARFCRLTFSVDALLARHLCHLERAGQIRRITLIGPKFKHVTYVRTDPAVRRTIKAMQAEHPWLFPAKAGA